MTRFLCCLACFAAPLRMVLALPINRAFGRKQGAKSLLREAAEIEHKLQRLEKHLDTASQTPPKHCETIKHCISMKDQYDVVPFETWGKLSDAQQREWEQIKCNAHLVPDTKHCSKFMSAAELNSHEISRAKEKQEQERRAKCAAAKPVKHALPWKSAQSKGGRPRLRVLTYATKLKAHMCRAIEIGLQWKVEWTVIGLGEPWSGNLKQKFEGTLAYLASVDPDDLIIFGDAFDVFYVGTEEQIVDTFLSWNVQIRKLHSFLSMNNTVVLCNRRARSCVMMPF